MLNDGGTSMDAQVQTRSCDRKRGQVGQLTSKGSRQICIPMTREQYDVIWNNPASVREYLEPLIRDYPEMFPAAVAEGYQLHGHLPESKKLPGVRLRQIKTNDGVYTLRPSFAFSYMTGTVDELEKPLLLLALHGPIWAVTHVFGRNDMYWQRLLERMGRNSLAGTTVGTGTTVRVSDNNWRLQDTYRQHRGNNKSQHGNLSK